jgi:hypothetical protein
MVMNTGLRFTPPCAVTWRGFAPWKQQIENGIGIDRGLKDRQVRAQGESRNSGMQPCENISVIIQGPKNRQVKAQGESCISGM